MSVQSSTWHWWKHQEPMLAFLGRPCTASFPCMFQDWQWDDWRHHAVLDPHFIDGKLSLNHSRCGQMSFDYPPKLKETNKKSFINDPGKGTVGTVKNWEPFISLQQILWTTLLSVVGGVSTLDSYFVTPGASFVSRPLWDLAGCRTALSLLWEVEKKIQVNKWKCRAILIN